MQTPEKSPWNGLNILASVQVEAAENAGTVRQECNLEVVVGHTYLPAYVSAGILYVQAPLRYVLEAAVEAISESFCNMEVRVSGAGGTTLSLDRDGSAIPSAWVAKSRVVGDSKERRF